MTVKIFCCYAHEDEPFLKELKGHLMPLTRQGLIEFWYDCQINAGANWESEIDKHLSSAQIVLLLISSSFMASDYCYSDEMHRAMKLYEQGKAYVIPVILRPTDWEDTPFSKLQVLPKEGKPITTWNNRDEAFLNVSKGIRKVIEEFPPPLLTNEKLSKPAEESEISSTTSEERSNSLVTTALEEAEKSRNHLTDIWLLLIKIQKRLNQPETLKTELEETLKTELEGRLIDGKINTDQVKEVFIIGLKVILNEMKRTREYIIDSQKTSILTKKITLLLKISTSIEEVNKAIKVFVGNKTIKSLSIILSNIIIISDSGYDLYRIYSYNNHLKKCKAYLIEILVEIS